MNQLKLVQPTRSWTGKKMRRYAKTGDIVRAIKGFDNILWYVIGKRDGMLYGTALGAAYPNCEMSARPSELYVIVPVEQLKEVSRQRI